MRTFLGILFCASYVGAFLLDGTHKLGIVIINGSMAMAFLVAFFVPSLIAFAIKTPFRWTILWMNAKYGVTGLGWIILMAELSNILREGKLKKVSQ